MAMSWIDYGFPDPTFQMPLLPMLGLGLALRERCTRAREHMRRGFMYGRVGAFPYSDSYIVSFLSDIQKMKALDWETLRRFDIILKAISVFFINRQKTEYTGSLYPPYYTWNELLDIVDNEDTTGVGAIDRPTYGFLPTLSVIWAKQRKRILDLLIHLPVDYVGDQFTAYSNQYYATWEELIEHTKSTGVITYGVELSDTLGDLPIYNYYRLGYEVTARKFVRIRNTANIRPNTTIYPELTGLDSVVFYDCLAQSISVFDTLGTSVALGRNWLNSPAFNLSLPFSQSIITAPDPPGYYESNGTNTGFHEGADSGMLCVTDFSSLFEFYENVDTPA